MKPQPAFSLTGLWRWLALGLLWMMGVACGNSVELPLPLAENVVTVRMAYGSEKEAWLEPLVAQYNNAGHHTADGTRIVVEAVPMGSVEAVDEMLAGTIQPTVWSPASSIYIPVANERWRAVHGSPLVEATPNDLVLSPVVIAMWEPMARALGWPDEPIGWSDVFELSTSEGGWADYGFPEWGGFKFGHTHPGYSNSGVTSVLAEAYAGAGKVRGLTSAEVQSDDVAEFMRTVEKSVIHYGRSTGFFAEQMFTRGPSYLSAAVLYENLIVEQENRRLAGESSQPPVVAIYPKEGTFWANNPYAIVAADWVTELQHEAALDFEQFLLAEAQQLQAIEYGFRPAEASIALSAPLDADHGVDVAQPQTVLEVPPAEVIEAALTTWEQTKKPVDLVVVMDISGSMSGDKINAARQSLAQFVDELDDGDRVQVVLFSDAITTLTPMTPVGEKREELQQRISGIFEQGGTRLYDAVAQSYGDLVINGDPDHIRAMVVLTDGRDTSSAETLDAVLLALSASAGEGGNAPKLFTIAFGSEADRDVLQQLSAETGARQYDSDPSTIRDIYAEIATFF